LLFHHKEATVHILYPRWLFFSPGQTLLLREVLGCLCRILDTFKSTCAGLFNSFKKCYFPSCCRRNELLGKALELGYLSMAGLSFLVCVVLATLTKFCLHARNMRFNEHNGKLLNIRIMTCIFIPVCFLFLVGRIMLIIIQKLYQNAIHIID
jgi:hypothetical protein